jgi:hypothetical protein
VDLTKAIRDLHEEKNRLDKVIAVLEQMIADGTALPPKARRGRKTMSEEERLRVSERMVRYHAERKAKMQEAQGDAAGASVEA